MALCFALPVRGWRAAVLLAAGVLFGAGKASAECGDYITYPNSHKDHHAAPAADHGATPSPARAPCHGPNCSGGPAREFPPTAPAPATDPTKEQARPAAHADDQDGQEVSPFDRDSDSGRPVRRAGSIFHPPRAG